MKQFLTLCIFICLLLSSCISTEVKLRNVPSGLQLYYNGSQKGDTPQSFKASNFVFSEHEIEIKYKGQKIFKGSLEKELKWGNILLFWLYVPLLWVYGPAEEQNINIDINTIMAKFNKSESSVETPLHDVEPGIKKSCEKLLGSFKGVPKKKIAVVEGKAGDKTDRRIMQIAYNLAFENIFNDQRFVVIERELMEKILSEQTMHLTGMVNDDDVKKLGKLSGAYYMLLVSVNNKQLVYRMVTVETGDVVAYATANLTE